MGRKAPAATRRIARRNPIGNHKSVRNATKGLGDFTKRPSWKMIGFANCPFCAGCRVVPFAGTIKPSCKQCNREIEAGLRRNGRSKLRNLIQFLRNGQTDNSCDIDHHSSVTMGMTRRYLTILAGKKIWRLYCSGNSIQGDRKNEFRLQQMEMQCDVVIKRLMSVEGRLTLQKARNG